MGHDPVDYDEPTVFAESNALLAVIRGDRDHAREILGGMTPNEIRSLAGATDTLSTLCEQALRGEGAKA
jgi:hypothetical protein